MDIAFLFYPPLGEPDFAPTPHKPALAFIAIAEPVLGKERRHVCFSFEPVSTCPLEIYVACLCETTPKEVAYGTDEIVYVLLLAIPDSAVSLSRHVLTATTDAPFLAFVSTHIYHVSSASNYGQETSFVTVYLHSLLPASSPLVSGCQFSRYLSLRDFTPS